MPGHRARPAGRGDRRGATNALKLGIDIGSLESAVLAGYPGSIASTWQQMGRAGRTDRTSAGALDQHIINHPEYFFRQNPERALINPDNLLILVSHIKCAAFELRFRAEEEFEGEPVREILDHLAEHHILAPGGRAHGDWNPAQLLRRSFHCRGDIQGHNRTDK